MFGRAQRKKVLGLRYMRLGREKMLSMGEYPHTSLELARRKTLDARAHNIDPSVDRVERAAEAKVADAITFEAVSTVVYTDLAAHAHDGVGLPSLSGPGAAQPPLAAPIL